MREDQAALPPDVKPRPDSAWRALRRAVTLVRNEAHPFGLGPFRGPAMAITKTSERPLSPHIQIYRWPMPMIMSILHRITGAGLYFGTLLMAWWLIAAGSGPNAYAKMGAFMGSAFGRLILFGYTWALIHHMLGGIRHLIWDAGYGFEPGE